jgi:hypothetical protein
MVLPEHIVLEPLAAAPASRCAGGAVILQRHPRFCSGIRGHPPLIYSRAGGGVMVAAQQLRAVTFSV